MPNGLTSIIGQIPKRRTLPVWANPARIWLDISRRMGPEQSGKLKLLILINGALLAWLTLRPARAEVITAVDDSICVLSPLLAALWCFVHFCTVPLEIAKGRKSWLYRHRRWSSFFFGMGTLSFAAGEAVWSYYEVVAKRAAPFPGLADAGYIGAYPFLLIGVLLLPRGIMPAAGRLRVLLDGLMSLSALITFSWFFVLGPTIIRGSETNVGKVLGAAYPIGDLVLLFCSLVVLQMNGSSSAGTAVRAMGFGMAFVAAADSAFGFQTLNGAFQSGRLTDVGWSLGYMLVAIGACAANSPLRHSVEHQIIEKTARHTSVWQALIPYALLPGVAVLAIYVHIHSGDKRLVSGVQIGATALVAVVLLRQIFSIIENGTLNRYLHQAYTELETKNQKLHALARTDLMTGLANHGTFQQVLKTEIGRAARSGAPISLILLDVDSFKEYNDTYGHPAGDAVLQTIARLLETSVRQQDSIARYGGEEFAILLPSADEKTAQQVAERVRENVEAYSLFQRPVTVSLGVVTAADANVEPSAIITCADRALYNAKRSGRNIVVCWEGPVEPRTCDSLTMHFGDDLLDQASGSTASIALLANGGERALLNRALSGLDGQILKAILGALELRDCETEGHSQRVVRFALRIAKEAVKMGISTLSHADVRELIFGALLHDVGKISVPDSILLKARSLNDAEWHIIRKHPEQGAALISGFQTLQGALRVIRHHHERWDGTGYPDGLKGEDIPLCARIFSVADTFDAMSSDRPYRSRLSYETIREEIHRMSGSQFDPSLVTAFLSVPEDQWKKLQADDGVEPAADAALLYENYPTLKQAA